MNKIKGSDYILINKINSVLIKEEENKFLSNFPENANRRNDYDSLMKYGFFHFTLQDNIPSISQNGIEARIGENSQGNENKKRAYFSIGGEGVLGIVNRAIFLQMIKLADERHVSMEDVRDESFNMICDMYKNSTYFRLDIEDGKEFDSSDFMTRRNSHTISNVTISPEKINQVSINGLTNALDIIEFFYNNIDTSNLRRANHIVNGQEYVEENYLPDFIDYIKKHVKEDEKVQVEDSDLKRIDLGEKKMEKDGYIKITIPKDVKKGFAFDFDIYIPNDVRENSNLMLNFDYYKFGPRGEAFLSQIQAPVMVPNIQNGIGENGEEINFDQFEPSALLDENGNKRIYGENINLSLVEQYKRAIDEAYRILKEREVIKQDAPEKVDVEGYSYHGVRAQRFAMLAPEKIRSVFVGGAHSSIPLPIESLDGIDLDYPIGFKGVDKILGEESTDRVLDDYKKVVQVLYATEQELKYDGSFSRDGKRVRDKSGNRLDYSSVTVSQHDISPDVLDVALAQIKLWGNDINDRANAAIDIVKQNGCALRKTKIYEGIDHHWSDVSRRLDSLTDIATALRSMDDAMENGEFNPYEVKIEGFDGGVDRIDTSYEDRRESLQRLLVGEGVTKEDFESALKDLTARMVRTPEDDEMLFYEPKKFMSDFLVDDVLRERALRDLEYVDITKVSEELGYHFTPQKNMGSILVEGLLAKKGDNSSGNFGKEAINKTFLSYGVEGVVQLFNRSALASTEHTIGSLKESKTHGRFVPKEFISRNPDEKLLMVEAFEFYRRYMEDNIYFVFDSKQTQYERKITPEQLEEVNNNIRKYKLKDSSGNEIGIFDAIQDLDERIKLEKDKDKKIELVDARNRLTIELRKKSKVDIDNLRGKVVDDEGAIVDRIDYNEERLVWADQMAEPHNVHTRIVEDEKVLRGVIKRPTQVISIDGKTPANGVQAMQEICKKIVPGMKLSRKGDQFVLDLFFDYVKKVEEYKKLGLVQGNEVDLSDMSRYPGLVELEKKAEERMKAFDERKQEAKKSGNKKGLQDVAGSTIDMTLLQSKQNEIAPILGDTVQDRVYPEGQ